MILFLKIMVKGEIIRNLAIFGVVLIVLGVLAFGTFSYLEKGKTYLYFNSESDFPDLMYLTNIEGLNSTGSINLITLGEDYEIMFTIYCNEKTKTKYKLLIDSDIYELEEEIELKPKEKKTFSININIDEEQKWRRNQSITEEWRDEIDLTRNSWLAGKNNFAVLIPEKGLPAIMEENYHLPMTLNISQLGEVYHFELSLDELRQEPFIHENIINNNMEFKKTETTNYVKLFVEADELILEATKNTKTLVSDIDIFTIKVLEVENGIMIDEDLGIEKGIEISFPYLIG
jgi:hypothetical protein